MKNLAKINFRKRKLEGLNKNPERGFFFTQKRVKIAKIGLKSCWHKYQIANRLAHNPPIIELYLNNGDLENNIDEIKTTIKKLKAKGTEVTIHQPNYYKRVSITLAAKNCEITKISEECYGIIYELCEKYALKGFIMHAYQSDFYKKNKKLIDKNRFIRQLNNQKEWHSKILLENSTVGFFKSGKDMEDIAKKTGVALCIDLCHLHITYQNNNKLERAIKNLKPHTKYYHIVDSTGTAHDSLEIGKGTIDFARIAKYLHSGIIEVNCKNQVTADEMIRSYYALEKIRKNSTLFREGVEESLSFNKPFFKRKRSLRSQFKFIKFKLIGRNVNKIPVHRTGIF